ncbi:DUF2752 domain-containing protein [Promicromonospora thailandica]|uniref:DUF2752 domain-containing protein n=1 Tax=Promicromonospora thailandica TaxID=765201 RepID=A0A9X2G6Y6_9MICO|nr:DUF2752 domain-containing protein [Promicromonospora thailandica]MCP2266765.1 Protein of unknown function (DUF2752) [Promicromonospora thailandica]BFF21929.1 DUF2752 domain-containing protein [Promicromonospora thailandica]
MGPIPEPARRRALRAPLLTGGAVAAATLVLAVRDPHVRGSYGFCPLLELTGLACPLCGGLRATHDLAHLDLAGAWSANALWTVAAPVVVALWVAWLVTAARGRPVRGPSATAAWVTLGVALAFLVVRNLPVLQPYLTPWL